MKRNYPGYSSFLPLMLWSDLAWAHADQAKGKRDLAVPLSDAAIAVLQRQLGAHARWVFPYRGGAIKQPTQVAWLNACKAAKLGDFHWHDLRHTWASWHVQNGTPLAVLQELGDWRDLKMVLRYAHLAPGHLAVRRQQRPRQTTRCRNRPGTKPDTRRPDCR